MSLGRPEPVEERERVSIGAHNVTPSTKAMVAYMARIRALMSKTICDARSELSVKPKQRCQIGTKMEKLHVRVSTGCKGEALLRNAS